VADEETEQKVVSRRAARSAFDAFAKKLSFQARTIEIKAHTGRVFVLHELNGEEQMVVDQTTKFENVEILYKRVIAAITKIEGIDVPTMRTNDDFLAMFRLIRGSELDELVGRYSSEFLPKGEQLKNESGGTPASKE
jgi:hypothetical protein